MMLRDFIIAAVSITCVRLLMKISKLRSFLLQKFPACAIKGNERCDERECEGYSTVARSTVSDKDQLCPRPNLI
jgi:hypothetical protein